MKKILRYVGIGIGVIVGIVALGAAYIGISGIPKYEAEKIAVTIQSTPERVARGKVLAEALCNNCHLNPATGRLTGKFLFDAPPEFGKIYSKNITQHPVKGIKSWTDGELVYLFRTGLKPDGQYLPPYMPKLPHVSDEDIASIISFLRSNEQVVQADPTDNIPTEPSFLTKFLCRVAFKPLPYPKQAIPHPDTNNTLAHGKYLFQALDCYACHSADFKTVNIMEPEKSPGFGGGGNMLLDMTGRQIFSANISSDPATGIGKWSEADFIRAMKDGIRPDKKPLRYPMIKMPELSDKELSALYQYVKTIPAINNIVAAPTPYTGKQTTTSRGESLFYKYDCQSCHTETGIGVGDLTKAGVKYPTNDVMKDFLKNPGKYLGRTKMLAWDGIIKEEEYEDLCNHIRELGKRAQAGAAK